MQLEPILICLDLCLTCVMIKNLSYSVARKCFFKTYLSKPYLKNVFNHDEQVLHLHSNSLKLVRLWQAKII